MRRNETFNKFGAQNVQILSRHVRLTQQRKNRTNRKVRKELYKQGTTKLSLRTSRVMFVTKKD